MGIKKRDNHFTGDKVALRLHHAPWPDTRPLKVLDVYGGHGLIWRAIARKTGRTIDRISIDNRPDLLAFHAHGDSPTVMAGMALDGFDVIDIDGYGIPLQPLKQVVATHFRGMVFLTMIQTVKGIMPFALGQDLGFPDAVATKCPTMLGRRGFQYFKEWLALHGVTSIDHRSKNRKHYLAFRLNDAARHGGDCDIRPEDIAANRS